MDLTEDADYGSLRWRLRTKINGERAAGRSVVRDERIYEEHDTPARRCGEPCQVCTEPWPCPTVLGLLSAD